MSKILNLQTLTNFTLPDTEELLISSASGICPTGNAESFAEQFKLE